MLSISKFQSVRNADGTQSQLEWDGFADYLTCHVTRDTKDGELYSPAIYNTDNVHRRDANVIGMSAVCIDFDNAHGRGNDSRCTDDPSWPEDHVDNLAGLTYAIHSTYTNTKDWPRWRLIIPFDRPATPKEFKQLFAHVVELLGHDTNIDMTCGDLSRAYWAPSCPSSEYLNAFSGYFTGSPLTVDDIIVSDNVFQIPVAPTAQRASAEFMDYAPKYAGRNDALKAQVAACVAKGIGTDAIVAEILAYDKRHHAPPLFSDTNEFGSTSSPQMNAMQFVVNNMRSINERRASEGLEAQVPIQAQEVAPFPLVWFHDVKPTLHTTDFIENVLTDNGLSVVYGDSNTGKTFLVLDMALHLARGVPWQGKEVEQGAVIYVAAEGGHGIFNRIEAWRKYYKVANNESMPLAIVNCPINLLDAEVDVQRLNNLIDNVVRDISMPVKLIVIDTLARALAGGNENSSEDMGALVMNADMVRNHTGSHVCFIHHSGKDQAKGARGHSSLRAATDTEIEISRAPGMPAKVRISKQRDLDMIDLPPFELEAIKLGTNKRGKPVMSCVIVKGGLVVTLTKLETLALTALQIAIKRNQNAWLRLEKNEVRQIWLDAGATKAQPDSSKRNSERAMRSKLLTALENKGRIEQKTDAGVEYVYLVQLAQPERNLE